MSKTLPPLPRSSSSAAASASATATATAAGHASSATTYELQQAHRHALSQSDPISWSSATSYRRRPYRHLHHQTNTIGTFHVRLLAAHNLTRSHWTVLGMGPVRHLGLSRSHGAVSSYAELSLGWSSNSASSSSSSSSSSRHATSAEAGSTTAAAASTSNAPHGPNPNAVDAVWRRNSSSAGVIISEVNSRESEEEEEEEKETGADYEDPLDRKPAALPLDQLDPQGQHQQQQPDLMSMSLREAASQQMLQSVGAEWSSGLGGTGKKASATSYKEEDDEDENDEEEEDGKLPADDAGSTHVESMHDDLGASHGERIHQNNRASRVHRSSTVPRNSNPIWPTAQRDGNRSLFAIRLPKRKRRSIAPNDAAAADGGGGGGGSTSPSNNTDGQRIQLRIVVKEEMTGVEHALPDPFGWGLTKGGSGAASRDGTIGWATLDVTDLALGLGGGTWG